MPPKRKRAEQAAASNGKSKRQHRAAKKVQEATAAQPLASVVEHETTPIPSQIPSHNPTGQVPSEIISVEQGGTSDINSTETTQGGLVGLPNPLSYQNMAVTSVVKPLGLHVPIATKQKIWKSEFIELGSLLETKNPYKPSNPANPEGQQIVLVGGQLVLQPQTKPKQIYSIDTWTFAFTIFMSIFLEKHSQRARELIQYMDTIRRAARDFGGQGWLSYDVSFRQEQAHMPTRSWATLDHTLYLTHLFAPANLANRVGANFSPNRVAQRGQPSARTQDGFRGFRSNNPCFEYNKGKCNQNPCRYTHKCTRCSGYNHPVFKCSKAQGTQNTSKGPNINNTQASPHGRNIQARPIAN